MSSFHQYNGIASNVVPLALALFLGSWSDRRGRKLPLLMGLAGQTYYFIMLAVVATQGKPIASASHTCYWPACLPHLALPRTRRHLAPGVRARGGQSPRRAHWDQPGHLCCRVQLHGRHHLDGGPNTSHRHPGRHVPGLHAHWYRPR